MYISSNALLVFHGITYLHRPNHFHLGMYMENPYYHLTPLNFIQRFSEYIYQLGTFQQSFLQ